MRKRRIYLGLLLLAVGVVVGALLLGAFRSREPEYGGKKLSEWVAKYIAYFGGFPGNPEPEKAIQHIGTNALPYLMKWMLYETPPWKRKLYGSINPIIQSINSKWQLTDDRFLYMRDFGMMGMAALGPAAKAAIPDLIRVGKDPIQGGYASVILQMLGKEAIPALVTGLTNQDAGLRLFIVGQLREMRTNALPAVPALQHALIDPEWKVRDAATNAIRVIDWGWAE